ncbi:Glycosyl hydrolase family 76 [Chitinophaga sp. CF118]|uniref:glycoside hydrolase family 76 protein n=1 Tax=Chitinophaga sp. CF118 TaxID=1884367 RepID=UPI0008F4084D|nr:glycoside hydrolase family 76 protein [Chitinophaga sp. CF118]SFE80708.1 Glycosyl hydrolase family 76 [Chitinophaga sp. CF118]
MLKNLGSFFLLLCVNTTFGQNAEHAEALLQAVNTYLYNPETKLYLETINKSKNENPHTFLWGMCGMVQATNELEALHPGKQYMSPVINAINAYYNPKAPAPGYDSYVVKEKGGDRFYDDNQWIGIAYLDAYERTKKKWFLEKGMEIYRFMMTGYDTISGGGLYWKEGDKNTKNTCSNGPAILVALQMYQVTHKKPYLDTALLLYTWTNKYLQSASGIYWDAIRVRHNNKIDSAKYTYNSGTMLESNVKLYNITHDKKYLAEAQRIAAATYAWFFHNDRLPSSYWFNAVLLRGYEALYAVDHNRKYINAMQVDADKVWETERDKNNLVGPRPDKDLLGQAGMIEIYARLARIK